MLELADQHRVSKMQIGRGGIEPGLHAKWDAALARGFQAIAQIGATNNFRGSLFEEIKLFFNRSKGRHGFLSIKGISAGFVPRGNALRK